MDPRVSKIRQPCHGAVAQSVERPSKVPVWCNSTDVGLNPGATVKGGWTIVAKNIHAAPSDENSRIKLLEDWEGRKKIMQKQDLIADTKVEEEGFDLILESSSFISAENLEDIKTLIFEEGGIMSNRNDKGSGINVIRDPEVTQHNNIFWLCCG